MAETDFGAATAMDLRTFEAFRSHQWVRRLVQQYAEDAVVAKHAATRIVHDLEDINERNRVETGRVTFSTIEARVKTESSYLAKVYRNCCVEGRNYGITQDTLRLFAASITDLCGVRFACPYVDEVKPAIEKLIRPRLAELGYGTNLVENADRDLLDSGDDHGCRSYHLFITVPTLINIFGESKLCLCEIQARSELQHVWAVKSHNLLYKPQSPAVATDIHVIEDMRQISNTLRAADQFLISIRDRLTAKA